MMTIERWLKAGKYLPAPLRDFHDAKDVFKAIHENIDVKGHEYIREIDWVAGQCYVIDIFLWWMARRGYTLQRTKARLPFRELTHDVADTMRRRTAAVTAIMKTHRHTDDLPSVDDA